MTEVLEIAMCRERKRVKKRKTEPGRAPEGMAKDTRSVSEQRQRQLQGKRMNDNVRCGRGQVSAVTFGHYIHIKKESQ